MTSAVVLGLGVNGLGVVRALGRRGIKVVGTYTNPQEIGRHSRYCEPIRLPSVEAGHAQFLEGLIAIGKRLGDRPVIFPTSDAAVWFLSEERAALEPYFRLDLPAAKALRSLMDKSLVVEMAGRHGIASPSTWVFTSSEAAEHAAESLPYPCLVKPRMPWGNSIPGVPKVTLIQEARAFRQFVGHHAAVISELVVQEVIPGDDSDHAFLCLYMSRSRGVLGALTGRTIHRYPPGLGWTATCLSTPIPELEDAGTRLLAAAEYHGLAEVEFKRNCRTGRYMLFEVNTRTWAYNALAPTAGVDLVGIAYDEAVGSPTRARPTSPRVRAFMNAGLEAGFIWRTLRRGRVPRIPWRALTPGTAHAYFCWDDPLPAWYRGRQRFTS